MTGARSAETGGSGGGRQAGSARSRGSSSRKSSMITGPAEYEGARRTLARDRKFVDSPLEEAGFEPLVPPMKGVLGAAVE